MTRPDERLHPLGIARARPTRTLGEAIKSLPIHAPFGSPRLELGTLPDDTLPELVIRGVADEPTKARNSPSKEYMRAMTWIPIPLDRGETLAHLLLPTGLTATELETIAEVIRKLVPPVARAAHLPQPQAEPRPFTAPIRSELELETGQSSIQSPQPTI